jgi:hypothetical protein
MCIGKVLFLDVTKRINVSEVELLSLSACEDGSTLLCVKELTLLIEKLKGVPLLRVM